MKEKGIEPAEKLNILIVEDKHHNINLFKKLLPGKQYNFHMAKNDNDAIEKLSREEYEIIIIPKDKFTGAKDVELINKIKDVNYNSCFIVTSGFPSIEEALKSIKSGAYDYIPVPFDKEAAKIILNKAVELQQLYKERDKYRELSNLDGLTNLFNHRHFHELLDTELNRSFRYHRSLSLLMIDIDNFKTFNDMYGHLEGDRFLKKMAKFLLQNVRNVDSVCRYGGEEFTIILPETNKDGAFNLTRRLRSTITTSIYKTKKSLYKFEPTISIGLTCYPLDAKEKNELIKNVDLALYEAKRLGKNRICIFTPHLTK